MTTRVYDENTEAQLLPRIVRLAANLYGAAFTLMKLVPARYILRSAQARGQLGERTLIVETTSGTFGLALAMEAALLGRRLVLVSDPVVDANLRLRLEDLGARVEICPEPADAGGYQEARLRRVAQIRARHPDSFCPQQYSNPDNPAAYGIVAEQLLRALGAIDCVVGPVGSGGSMCGTVGALRRAGEQVQAVAVDTHHSVLFGQPDGTRALRGLGNSLLPPNLDHQVFDEVHWCSAAEAFAGTRGLHRRHTLFQGPTSGAAYTVAAWWAARHPDATCVVLLPDEGYRYQQTVYDDAWLAASGHLLAAAPSAPVQLARPDEHSGRWSWFPWARRSYADVLGTPQPPALEAAEAVP